VGDRSGRGFQYLLKEYSRSTFMFLFLLFVFLVGGFLLGLWMRKSRNKLIEDALKHIGELAEREKSVSLESLSIDISLSMRRTRSLGRKMEDGGLIRIKKGNIRLTKEGHQQALQLIRAHRLLERYLADEARMPLKDLHVEADRREHDMSSELTDALEAHLGYPRHDPHGDPIPTPEGDLPKESSYPLSKWPLERLCEIVHIEDEPPAVYTKITEEGLKLGMEIEILKMNDQRILIWDGEREHILIPEVAANIFVSKPTHKRSKISTVPLSVLTPGEKGTVVDLECQGLTRRRFLDLGLLPGTLIEVLMPSALGKPYAYRLRDTVIAIRSEQAQQILIEPLGKTKKPITAETRRTQRKPISG
jgi:DtxR family Mn-dependent transcriptional regulator